MSDTRWMDLMGIGPSKPTESNCPRILSLQVKQVWPEIIRNNLAVIAGMPHETAWNFALSIVFEQTSGDGLPWLDAKISGRPAQEKLSLDVKARRAVMVAIMDTTKALASLTISNIERTVTFDKGCLRLKTTADCKLVKGVSEVDWLSNLVKRRFKVFGYTYRLFGLPAGSTIHFLNRPSGGIQFVSEMVIPTTFIPPDSTTPLVNPEIFSKIVVDKVWLPAVRVFKYKTTKRKNSLL
jgi:hypothetical protein